MIKVDRKNIFYKNTTDYFKRYRNLVVLRRARVKILVIGFNIPVIGILILKISIGIVAAVNRPTVKIYRILD